MTGWLVAFALTVVVEVPIVVLVAPSPLRKRIAVDAVFVNLCTHPLAWVAFGTFGWPWTVVELLVTAFELLAYRQVTSLSWGRAAAAATIANGVTAALSFVL